MRCSTAARAGRRVRRGRRAGARSRSSTTARVHGSRGCRPTAGDVPTARAGGDCGRRRELAPRARPRPGAGMRARPRRWAVGAYFDGVGPETRDVRRPRSARCTCDADATSASRRCQAASPTRASSPPIARALRDPSGCSSRHAAHRSRISRTVSRDARPVTRPVCLGPLRGRGRGERRARAAARRRCGGLHRSDDRRRAALRAARRRARRARRRSAALETSAAGGRRTSALSTRAPPRVRDEVALQSRAARARAARRSRCASRRRRGLGARLARAHDQLCGRRGVSDVSCGVDGDNGFNTKSRR